MRRSADLRWPGLLRRSLHPFPATAATRLDHPSIQQLQHNSRPLFRCRSLCILPSAPVHGHNEHIANASYWAGLKIHMSKRTPDSSKTIQRELAARPEGICGVDAHSVWGMPEQDSMFSAGSDTAGGTGLQTPGSGSTTGVGTPGVGVPSTGAGPSSSSATGPPATGSSGSTIAGQSRYTLWKHHAYQDSCTETKAGPGFCLLPECMPPGACCGDSKSPLRAPSCLNFTTSLLAARQGYRRQSKAIFKPEGDEPLCQHIT